MGCVGILSGVLVGATACAPPPPVATIRAEASPPPVQPAPDTPTAGALDGVGLEQELEDVTYRQTRGTAIEWELHAREVRQRKDEPAHLVGVTLHYYGGELEATVITADEAEYDPETQNATLRGHVRIVTPAGDSLESPLLIWDAEAERLHTEAEVTLRRGNSYISGVGLATSPGLEDAQMFQVRGIFDDAELAG